MNKPAPKSPAPQQPTKPIARPAKSAAHRSLDRAVIKTAIITIAALFVLILTAAATFFVVDRTNVDYHLTHDLVSAVSSRWTKLKETAGVTEFTIVDHTGDTARFNRLLDDYEQAVDFLSDATGLRDSEIRAAYDAFRPISNEVIANIRRTGTLERADAQRVDAVLRSLFRIAYKKHTGNEPADICDEACILAQRSRDDSRRASISELLDAIELRQGATALLAPDPALISEFAATHLDQDAFRDPTTNSPFTFIGWSAIRRQDPDIGTLQYGGLGTTCNPANNIIASGSTSVALRTRLEDGTFHCRAITLGTPE